MEGLGTGVPRTLAFPFPPLVPIPLFFAGPDSSLGTSLCCTLRHILLKYSLSSRNSQGTRSRNSAPKQWD